MKAGFGPGRARFTGRGRSMPRMARVLLTLAMTVAGVTAGLGPDASSISGEAGVPPFRGTSEVTYTLEGIAPPSAVEAVGRYLIVSHWSVADPLHWRLDSRTWEPALQSNDQTVVASGSSLIWYQTIYKRAWTMSLGANATFGSLGTFQGGSLVGVIESMGSEYLTYLRQHGGHYRLVGSHEMLGRLTDEYEVSSPGGGPDGTFLVWIDRQYSLVLLLEMPGTGSNHEQPAHWTYRVTSLAFGQGPPPGALAYRPPVKPRRPTTPTSSSGSGATGPDREWQVPKGFIHVRTAAGYSLSGSGEGQDPMWGSTSDVQALFTAVHRFIYVQEHVRAGGLPASLRAGTAGRAGRCTFWMGRISGLRWLSMQRRNVSLLATSNVRSASALRQYAVNDVCQ